MRVFLGVPVPPSAQPIMKEACALLGAFPEFKDGMIPAEKWHITLHFLGTLPEGLVEALREELKSLNYPSPFSVMANCYGAFPSPSRAGVFWMGISDCGGLLELRSQTGRAIERVGLKLEERSFAPHLSLKRFRRPQNLKNVLDETKSPAIEMPVSEFALYQSHLGSERSQYKCLERFPL